MGPNCFLQLFAAGAEAAGAADAAAAPEETSQNADGDAPEGKRAQPDPGDAEKHGGMMNGLAAAIRTQRQNAQTKHIVETWQADAAALREIYPGFDLQREAQANGEFARLLRAGVSVRRAYEAANLERILSHAMRYAAQTAGKKTADALQQQAGRVQENAVLDRAPSLARKDVNSLTQRDILQILDEVGRGAKITF